MGNLDYFLKYWILALGAPGNYITVRPPFDEEGRNPVHGPRMTVPERLFTHVDYYEAQGTELGDCLAILFGGLVVSERAAKVISTLTFPNGLVYVPTPIFSCEDEEIGSGVSIYYRELARDAIDLVRSGYNPMAGPNDPKFTHTPVVRREVLDGSDSFPASYVAHICTERFRQAVLGAGLTNFTFNETVIFE